MIQINPLQRYIDGGARAAITTPPSASLVFDLPGRAIWVKGVKLKGTDHTYTFSHDNYISLTNTPGSNESEDILIGINTTLLKQVIDTTYGIVNATTNGLAPMFSSANKATAAAATTYNFLGIAGTTLKWYSLPWRNVRINAETTDKLGVNDTSPLIISLGTGISVTWDSSGKKIVITNTAPDVNHNTDSSVAQTRTVLNKDYPLILKGSADSTGIIAGVNFNESITYNPSTSRLLINSQKVVTVADIYVGATASAAATSGLVPAATSAQRTYFLRGDGTWTTPQDYNTWRPIKVNSSEKLGSGTDTGAVDFVAGTGITLGWDATNKKITITNSAPDQNHNTDRTGIKLGTVSGTKKTDSTVILANSTVGLTIAGGTNKFSIGDGTNYIEVPITISHGLSTKNITINGAAYAIYTSASSLPTFVAPGSYAGTGGYILATNSAKNGLEWVAKPISNVTTTAVVAASATGTSQITSAQTNPYYNLLEGGAVSRSIRFVAGTGITISAATDGLITITNASPDLNHNTDRTGVKLGTVSGTQKTDSTLIIANSGTGLVFQGGTNLFKIGDGTNYIQVPITPSFTVSNKAATIGTTLTTIATIAGVDITAKIGSYATSDHTHSVKINGSTKTIAAPGGTAVDLGSYLPLAGGTMVGNIVFSGDNNITWSRNTDSASISFKNTGDGDSDSYMSFVTADNGNEYFRFSHTSGSNVEWATIKSDGIRVKGTLVSLNGHKHAYTDLTGSGTTANQAIMSNGTANGWKLAAVSLADHTHPLSIAADSGTSSIALAASTKYKLTAGGSTYVFTSTPDENVKQTNNDNNQNSPILLKNGTGTGNITSGTIFADGVTVNPSTNSLTISGSASSILAIRGHRLGYRHLDAGPKSSWSDSRLYIGYNGFNDDDGVTESIGFYRSTGTGTYTRTLWAEINSNGLYALTRFGVNGQNTGYNFYVNGSSYMNGSLLMNGNISFSNSGTGFRGINYGTMGDNDLWRIGGAATGSNAGYMEIATADDATEPIYVRQYTGVFTNLVRTAALLDASGNTSFPGSVGIGTTSPSYKLHVDGDIYSNGFRHSSVNSNDYVLLAGAGYGAFNDLVYTYTITINGDSNTYYPVVIDASSDKRGRNLISIWKNLGSTTASYSGNHSNGTSSMWLMIEGRSCVWDGNGGYFRTIYKSEPYATLISEATTVYSSVSVICVYLRGGGTEYKISTSYNTSVNIYYSRTNLYPNNTYPAIVEPRTTLGNRGILNGYFYGNISGNAATASKWATARTLTLTGSVTGSVSIDGSGNVSLATTTNHTHAWADITGKATSKTAWGLTYVDANGSLLSISGNMINVGSITFTALTGTNSRNLLYQTMADNDYFRLTCGATASNSGYVEFVTGDDGTEPIYFKLASSATLTLLDGSHNSIFPGVVTANRFVSNVATGTLPYACTSTTVNTNLNADLLDGCHASDFVRAYGTTNDNIDSDWGQSFKTFDPIPSGNPPAQNPNISTINIGNNFIRRKQLAFLYNVDDIYYRRRTDGGWNAWKKIAFTSDIPTVNNASLTLQTAGTTQTTFYANDSTNRTFNVTCANIGAATSGHTHRYINSSGFSDNGSTTLSTWGTLTSANSYTGMLNINESGGGSWEIAAKSGQISMLIDGYYYQNEGRYRTTDVTETVTALGTSGNYLTWTKNGSTNNITVPYATNSDTVDGYHASALFTAFGNSGNDITATIGGTTKTFTVNYANNASKLNITGYQSAGLSFNQTSDSFDGNSGWCHYIICNHGDGASYYHYTIGLPFWGKPIYRRQTGNTSSVTSWYTFWTSEGDNSTSGSCYAAHYYENSDARLKHDILPISKSVKQFKFHNDERIYYGFIALELEILHPELVDSSQEYKTVNYDSAICYYIAELENKVQKLEDEINKLKNK